MAGDRDRESRVADRERPSDAITPRDVVGRMWLIAKLRAESAAGGVPLSARVLRIAAETVWLVRLAHEPERESLLAEAHGAAIVIAAEALLGAQEADPRLKHRTPNYLQRWMLEKLKREDLSIPRAWDELLDLSVEVLSLASYLADLSGTQRESRAATGRAPASSRNELPAVLRGLAVTAATFAARTWLDEAPPIEDIEMVHAVLELTSSSVEIVDPQIELVGLQSRRDALRGALLEATGELERSGAPLPGRLVDQLDLYERDVKRLASLVESEPQLVEIERNLADRDPRRKALRALAEMTVTDGESLAAVEDVRVRAATTLELLAGAADAPDLEVLLWLHDWIAAHEYGLERPDTDKLMGQLLKGEIPTTLAIPPEIDRLRLGLADGAEPTLALSSLEEGGPEPAPPASPAAAEPPLAAEERETPPESEPEPEPQTEPEPESEPAQLQTEPEPQPEPAPEPHTEPESERAPQTELQPPAQTAPQPPSLAVDACLLSELVEHELSGVAACYLAVEDPRGEALELLGLACAVQSSEGSCAREMRRRAERLIGLLDTEELAAIGFAAGLRCAITGPGAAVDILEGLKAVTADAPALAAIGDRVLLAAQQGFELNRDARGLDPASIEERLDRLTDEARRWLERPGMTRFQRASRLWRHWVDPREGRLGRMLATVAAREPAKLESLRAEVEDLHANIDRYLTQDDRALRGHGSQKLEGSARRELHRRAEVIIQVGVEAVAAWDAAKEAAVHAREVSPKNAAVMSELAAVLSQHLAEAQAEISSATGLALGAAALRSALLALDRGVSGRESAPSASEPSPAEALRGRLLATDIELDEELRPQEPLTEERGWAALSEQRDLRGSFETRVRLGELHNARLVLSRLAREPGTARDALESQLSQRAKQLTGELDAQLEQARSEIDWHWRLGHLSHETCTELFQALEPIAQRRGDPDATLTRQLLGLREQIASEAQRQIPARSAELRKQLVEVGAPDDEIRTGIEKLIAAEDIASAEEAIEALRRGDTPVLAVRQQHLGDLQAFLDLIPRLASAQLSLEAAKRAVVGHQQLAGLDFAPVRAADSTDAVTKAIEMWFALGEDGSLLVGDRSRDLRAHIAAVLQSAGFGIGELTVKSPFHKASSSVGALELEMRMRPRWKGIVPQFGSDAHVLRVVLLKGQAAASPDELFQVAHGNSETACVALVPRVLSLAQRRRIAALHRKDQSSAPVLFIDTAAFLYACSRGAMQIEPTMRATLPFTTVNPYMPFRGRQVPQEMFFGREQEVSSIISKDGYSFVYGGRRLGKSSLLEEVKRRANSSDEHTRAIVVDLQDAGIGRGGPPSTLLALLAGLLARELGVEQPSKRAGDAERLRQVVGAWLSEDTRRQLLVLLDETDEFLQADADTYFETVNQLHDLQARFKRRFKPVFAGLHHVKRFNDVPNQRLTHFGDKVAVGPLRTAEALALVEKPLAALGFRFDPPSAAHRILTSTRNQPSLIQLVCHHLLRHKLSEPPSEEDLPRRITDEDVANVLARPNVASEVRDRLELTINLDPRYRVILLVVAFGQLEREVEQPMRSRDIEQECRDWWAAGFAETADYEFDALLEEMCELGVLYRRDDAYRLQSPTIGRLLGTPDNIMDGLLRASSLHPPERFNASTHHEALKVADDERRDPYIRNPLTIEQVQELCRRQNRLVVLLGTSATSLGEVRAALSSSGLEQSEGDLRQTFATIDKRHSEEGTRDAFLAQLRRVGKRSHKIVLLDNSAGEVSERLLPEQALKAIAAGGRGGRRGEEGTVCGLILTRASSEIVRELVDDDARERRLVLMPLRRWETGGLRAWSHDEVDELPLAVERRREELLEVTGGWPLLVDRVVRHSRGRGSDAFAKALADLRDHLETPAGARELLAAVGLETAGSLEYRAWSGLIEYGEPIALTRTITGDISELSEIEDERDAEVAYRTLRLMDALTIDERARTVATEPVLAAAWRLVHPG